VDEALQTAMLFSEMEFLPNLLTSSLDEVLPVGVGVLVMKDELGNLLGPVVTTIALDQSIDGCFDLQPLHS
jgi:hypothetical protein